MPGQDGMGIQGGVFSCVPLARTGCIWLHLHGLCCPGVGPAGRRGSLCDVNNGRTGPTRRNTADCANRLIDAERAARPALELASNDYAG